jgi:hypothetical protein
VSVDNQALEEILILSTDAPTGRAGREALTSEP